MKKDGVELLNLEDRSLSFISGIVTGLEETLLENKKDYSVVGPADDENYYWIDLELNKKDIIIRRREDIDIKVQCYLPHFIDEIELCSKFCFHLFKFYMPKLKFSGELLKLEENINSSFASIRDQLVDYKGNY